APGIVDFDDRKPENDSDAPKGAKQACKGTV
ncbi:unnamed protein product, partial [marine sediment metagenome]